ncbi:uncharacterized protein Dvar_77960 [Desulfosarcina variabilis str. Montpellier]|uniref:hypothetical protein n=1 Tax=Desulfosarcina variabilis TaxID=2300 RepID=UPI003AFB30C2
MPDYRLAYAVTDLEDNQLLPAGTRLTRQVMEDLASRDSGTIKTCRLLDFPQVQDDLFNYLCVPPYDVITDHGGRYAILTDIAGDVHVPETVMDSFSRFREKDVYTYSLTTTALPEYGNPSFPGESSSALISDG